MSPEAGGATSPELAVHIVGTDELKARAAEVSEQRLAEKLQGDGEGRAQRLRAIGRRIWYGNMAREHYLAKYSRQAKEEIQDSGNLYIHEGLDQTAHDEAMEATVLRFESEHDLLIHEEAGEARGEALADDEVGQVIKNRLREVISQFANGSLPPEAFEEEKNRVLADLAQQFPQQFEQSRMYADNLTKIAEQVKNQVQAGEDLYRVIEDVKFYIDKAHTGVRTEVEQNRVDKILDYLKAHHVFTNETAVAGAVSLAYSVARYSARTTLGVLGKLALPGISTGLLAGARENKRLKEERVQHNREMAQGKGIAPGSERREQMEGFRYETVGALDLVGELDQQLWAQNDAGETVEQDLSPDEIDLSITTLAGVIARQRLSDRHKIDLITFSSIDQVEYERLLLDVRTAQAKNLLRSQFNEQYEDLLRTMGDPDGFNTILEERISAEMQALGGEIGDKDKLFNDMKRLAVGKAAVKGALIGMAVGTISQEVMSVLRPDEHGLLDSALHHDKAPGAHQTLLRHMLMGREKQVVDSDHLQTLQVGEGGAHALQLPDNIHLVNHSDGSFALEGPGHHLFADHLRFNADGGLDEHSSEVLNHLGISETVSHLAPTGAAAEHTVSSGDFVAHHADNMTHIKRDGWYDNDTPMHYDSSGHLTGADLNETRLWWGSSTGMDDHGNYVMDASHMTPDGSFHAGLSVDAGRELQEGHLKALISVSKDSQHMVYEVPINAHGQIVIDPHSEVGRLFESSDGHAVFNGGYVEIAQVTGAAGGVEHVNILATHIGEDTGQVTDVVQDHLTPHTVTALHNFGQARSGEIDVPPVIPIVPRAGLERMMVPLPEELNPIEAVSIGPRYYEYGGYNMTQADRAFYSSRRSERLRSNPDARLDDDVEVPEYLEKQQPTYKSRIERLAAGVEPMSPECKLVIAIPVAGHQEADNIYRTLSGYLDQTADQKSFEVLLYVNNPDVDNEGNPLTSDRTLAEIERFRSDHPELPLRVIHEVLPLAEVNIGDIRKTLADTILMREQARGLEGNDGVIIVSNDADNVGIDRRYVRNFVKRFEENPNVDAMLGQIDWDPNAYLKYPVLHVATRFFLGVDMMDRRRTGRVGSSGANFAYRSSVYAAVGGYVEGSQITEDVYLGWAMRAAREGAIDSTAIGFAGSAASRIYTSARRAIHVYEQYGLSPIEQWNRGFEVVGDEVRGIHLEDRPSTVDFDNPEEVERFVLETERLINRTIGAMRIGLSTSSTAGEEETAGSRAIGRTLGFLGIEYEVVDDSTIHITDASRLVAGLKEYKDKGYGSYMRLTGQASEDEAAVAPEQAKESEPSATERKPARKSRDQLLNKANRAFTRFAEANPTLKLALSLIDQTEIDDVILSDAKDGPNIRESDGRLIVKDHKVLHAIQDYLRLKNSDGSDLSDSQLTNLAARLSRYARTAEQESAGSASRQSSPASRPRRTIAGSQPASAQTRPRRRIGEEAPRVESRTRQPGEIRFSNQPNPEDLSEEVADSMIKLIQQGQRREVGVELAELGLWRREERPDGSPVFVSINKPQTQRVFEALGQHRPEPGVFELPVQTDELYESSFGRPESRQPEVVEAVPAFHKSLDNFARQLRSRLRKVTTPVELWGVVREYEESSLIRRHPWGQPGEIPGLDFEIIAETPAGEVVKSELIRTDARLRDEGAYNGKYTGSEEVASSAVTEKELNPEAT